MKYLKRYLSNADVSLSIPEIEDPDLILCIPAYKEDKASLLETITSLESAYSKAKVKVCVLILINYKYEDPQVLKTNAKALYHSLKTEVFAMPIYVFIQEMNAKKAGVGMARKKLMDLAFRIFEQNEKNGIIVNLDADTTVSDNYFQSIVDFFNQSECEAASIAFKHRYTETKPISIKAIDSYELHLRYFINMQRLLFLPFAYQTIGSAMAVKSFAYAKEGGMPLKQAGEDFYFLHKYTKNISLEEINNTLVYPSNRASDRVPFGTGKAVDDFIHSEGFYKSYNPLSFELLSNWLEHVLTHAYQKFDSICPNFNCKNAYFLDWLEESNADNALKNIASNSSNFESYIKRFFQWFDAFQLMKYLHYMRDKGLADLPILDCTAYLFDKMPMPHSDQIQENLNKLRDFDLKNNYSAQWRAGLISKLERISASF